MNFEFDVDLERPEIGIESLTIDGIEFALVALVHETRYEHFDVFCRCVRYNNPGFNTRRRELILNVKLRSEDSPLSGSIQSVPLEYRNSPFPPITSVGPVSSRNRRAQA